MRAENLLDLSTLRKGEQDSQGNAHYELAGRQWRLYDWDFLPAPELRLQSGQRQHHISCALEDGKLRGTVECTTPEGLGLKAVLTADNAEALAQLLLDYEWPKRKHRDITWYNTESKFFTTRWEAILGSEDKGVMIEFQEVPANTWLVSRELSLSGATLNLHYHGQDHSLAPGGTDGRLFTFEEAANQCMSLIQAANSHIDKNDDKYAAAYAAGRASVFDAIDALRRGPRTQEGGLYGHTG
jgi:hypothetical protein